MKFYHCTDEASWEMIKAEGVLFGIPYISRTIGQKVHIKAVNRYTYLAPLKKDALGMGRGDVLLEVEYEPRGVGVRDKNGDVYDNYGFDPPPGQICWQFSVFKSIDISSVRRLA